MPTYIYTVKADGDGADASGVNSGFTVARASYTVTLHQFSSTMGNLKKKRRLKMNKHKRRKRLKSHRHKKRSWQQ